MKRTVLAAALALAAAGAQGAVTELVIYKQDNFRGASQVVKGEVAHLEGGFAGEASSLVVRGGFWEACTGDHFTGQCYVLREGEYRRLGRELDDRIIAVRFLGADERTARRTMKREWREAMREDRQQERREARREAREERREAREERREERREARWQGAIDLYNRPDFRGRSVRVEDNVADLQGERFDGRASSAIVREGTWQLCSEPRYRGRCETLAPGAYPRLAGLDDRVSSLRQVR